MSYDSTRTRPPTTLAPVPDELLAELVDMLAAVLHLKSEKIDPRRTFRSLGLDSLLTVEFVATVNARYGTDVKPDALFDQPTPLAFAHHVIRERAVRDDAPGGTPVPPGAGPGEVPAREAVLDVLREELARILCCDPWEVGPTAAFNVLGIDSILGAQFVATINEIYGLRERAVTLYEHPNLEAMAAYVVSLTGSGPAPSRTPDFSDLSDLLDAVRDDRISVDQALALLPRRA
ncbi:acyl carrier protein [Streptomyces sp. NPDC057336]|uniref:acyl carrier protein n=1 Tax=Streptomyces sp. NPDC057336 TaxID=3346102 RepID=UPI0036413BDA